MWITIETCVPARTRLVSWASGKWLGSKSNRRIIYSATSLYWYQLEPSYTRVTGKLTQLCRFLCLQVHWITSTPSSSTFAWNDCKCSTPWNQFQGQATLLVWNPSCLPGVVRILNHSRWLIKDCTCTCTSLLALASPRAHASRANTRWTKFQYMQVK